MTKRHYFLVRFLFASFLALLIAGCVNTQSPITYYNLTPLVAERQALEVTGAYKPLAVGIGPVSFPEALDQDGIASRLDAQRLMYNDFHRWSGSLAKGFTDVLMEDLASRLPAETTIAVLPWGSFFQPTCRLTLHVIQFDGKLGDEVVLNARWTLTNASGKEALLTRKSTIRVKTAGKDYQDLVAALSQAVAEFSTEIAGGIQAELLKTAKND